MRLLGWKMKCFFIVFPILEIKDPFHLKFVLVNELDHLVISLPSKFSHSLPVSFLSIWCCMSWIMIMICEVLCFFLLQLGVISFSFTETTMIEPTICLACRLWLAWRTHLVENFSKGFVDGFFYHLVEGFTSGSASYASHCAYRQLRHV